MSQHDGEYDELVGRILHAAADLAEPADDGLDRIRARLETPYPRPVAWLLTASAEVTGRALSGLLSARARLRAVLAAATERLRLALGARSAPAQRVRPAGYQHGVVTRLEDMPGWLLQAPDGDVLDGAAPLGLPGLLRRSPRPGRPDLGSPWRGARRRWLAPAAAAVLVAAVASMPTALSHVLQGRRAWSAQSSRSADNQAAAWVAAQAGKSAVVACDPVMCMTLRADGFPGRLYPLKPVAAYPHGASVMVVTPAVRTEYGQRVTSAYAPAVLASFGSGSGKIQVRVTAPHGAAAFRVALSADLAERRQAARSLLPNYQIAMSGLSKRQFRAGLVDSRLVLAITDVAAYYAISIVAFGDSGPGAGAGIPLRSVDLAQAGGAAGLGTAAFVRALKTMLQGEGPPYRPAQIRAIPGPGGRFVIRIEFPAPEPLGLIDSGAGGRR